MVEEEIAPIDADEPSEDGEEGKDTSEVDKSEDIVEEEAESSSEGTKD